VGRRLVGGLHERLAEPGARLLPLALCAPQLTLLHAVHFPALFGIASGPPDWRFWRGGETRLGREANIFAGHTAAGDGEGCDGDGDGQAQRVARGDDGRVGRGRGRQDRGAS